MCTLVHQISIIHNCYFLFSLKRALVFAVSCRWWIYSKHRPAAGSLSMSARINAVQCYFFLRLTNVLCTVRSAARQHQPPSSCLQIFLPPVISHPPMIKEMTTIKRLLHTFCRSHVEFIVQSQKSGHSCLNSCSLWSLISLNVENWLCNK